VGEELGGNRLTVGPDQVATFRVLLRAPHANLHNENTPVIFSLIADDGAHTAQDSVFLSPPRR